jgi:DNA polymerase-3 subunit chi
MREEVHSPTMTRLVLHDLPSPKRAGELALLIERLVSEGRRLVVWVADDGRRQIFDDWLWTFDRGSFVPHALWQPSLGEVEEPVVLVGEPGRPNEATILVVGDGLPPEDWAREFDEVHEFIVPGEAGEKQREWWRRWSDEGGEA